MSLERILWLFLLAALTACPAKEDEVPAATDTKPQASAPAVDDSTAAVDLGGNAVAEVGGLPISTEEFRLYLESYPARMKESVQGREHVLQSLIEHLLLQSEAKRLGLDRDTEFLRKVDNYRRNLLNNLLLDRIGAEGFTVTEAEAQAYFDAHPEEFDRPERVHARHILLDNKKTASDLLAQIRAGKSFERLAREHSRDAATRGRGGDLGAFSRTQRPELAKVAFALAKPGAVSGPTQSKRGFHLIQLVRRIAPVKESFAQVGEGLISRLRARKRQDAKNTLLKKLRADTPIKIHQPALEAMAQPAAGQ